MDLPGLQESPHAKDQPTAIAQTRRRVSAKYPGLRIGTSGYSFPDWIGAYYPHGTPRGKMFEQYVQDFATVEINSTYYGIPHARVFSAMEKKSPAGFDFIVKTHGSFTHERDHADANIPKLLEAVSPLRESGRLSGLLAQFPYSFKRSSSNLDYIRDKNSRLGSTPLFVEFRHDSWLRQDVREALASEGVGYCNVDEPQLPHLLPPESEATTATGYVRLHGRNSEKWWEGGGERYNYAYTDDQLREWVLRLDSLREKANQIYVFFNNCHLGRAVRDAHRFMELLADSEV